MPTSHVKIAQVVSVIQVISTAGTGVDGDPVREVIEYYTLAGNLIARIDHTYTAAKPKVQG